MTTYYSPETYNYLKTRLIMNIMPYSKIKENIKNYPITRILDTAIVYRFLINEKPLICSNIITFEDLEKFGIDYFDLIEDAKHYAPINAKASIAPLGDYLAELTGEDPELLESPLMVANARNIDNACILNYPNFLHNICRKLGHNIYIIPASIHELLIISESKENKQFTASVLNEMITGVNDKEVAENERLSYRAYHYNYKTDELEFADIYEAKKN